MGMVFDACVKIAARTVNDDFVDQTSFAKGAQGVVDRSQADLFARATRQGKQAFGGNMAILTITHQQPRQCQALTGRAQTTARQPIGGTGSLPEVGEL